MIKIFLLSQILRRELGERARLWTKTAVMPFHQTSQPTTTPLWVPSLSCLPLMCSTRTGTHRYHHRISLEPNLPESIELLLRIIKQYKLSSPKINAVTPLIRAPFSQFITQSPPPPPPPPLPPQVNGSDSSTFPKISNGLTGILGNSRPSTGHVKVRKCWFYSLQITSMKSALIPLLSILQTLSFLIINLTLIAICGAAITG